MAAAASSMAGATTSGTEWCLEIFISFFYSRGAATQKLADKETVRSSAILQIQESSKNATNDFR